MQYQRMRVYGRVQGVFFRDAACRKARKLSLAGYVKNLPDGSVEIVASGGSGAVEQLFAWAKRGPLLARVERFTRDTVELPEELEGFEMEF